MVVHRRKKNVKQRGSKMHGWGIKKHRGAGNRGGRGRAGSGKRAASKKPSILKEFGNSYFGKKGFTSLKQKTKINVINLNTLETNIPGLLKRGILREEKGAYLFDAKANGYTKVLAKGKIKNKFIITTPSISKKAKEVIEAAGGQVVSEKEDVSD